MDDLDQLDVSRSIKVALRKESITTISKVRGRCRAGTLLHVPGIGPAGLRDIVSAIHKFDDCKLDPFRRLYLKAGVFALLLGVIFSIWAFTKSDLRQHQYFILIWILPLTSGIVAGSFSGSITTKLSRSSWNGLVVAATGGAAVWLITFLMLPRLLPPRHLDSEYIQELNRKLKEKYGDDVGIEFIQDNDGKIIKIILRACNFMSCKNS